MCEKGYCPWVDPYIEERSRYTSYCEDCPYWIPLTDEEKAELAQQMEEMKIE